MTLAKLAALAFLAAALPAGAQELKLGLPAACTLGIDCFVQQLPDMDAGKEAVDPFCGGATYEGHDGLDLRIRSMTDVTSGVDVVAVADGEILRRRDGVADHLVMTPADRKAVEDTECGNGVVVRHEDGYESQYCHMKQGSVVVSAGDTVAKGQKLGQIGASGLAQFPHVHVTLRKDGKKIDPTSGKEVGTGCEAAAAATSLWDDGIAPAMTADPDAIIGLGFSGSLIEHARLVAEGPPAGPTTASEAFVAWVWLINLHKDDVVELALLGADGKPVAARKSEPMDRSKATYSFYVGKKQPPAPGDYTAHAIVWRDGKPAFEEKTSITIQ